MLLTARKMNEFSFSKLMGVYRQANREHGALLAPEEPEDRQLQLAEEDFYAYLHDCFFTHPGAVYCIWEENGQYISALRLEPYRDGLLLEALETAPDCRQRGYALRLIQEVQRLLEGQGSVRIYSHVSRNNTASMKTHRKCGFEKHLDYAAYIDGSVDRRADTLRYEKNISEIEKNN